MRGMLRALAGIALVAATAGGQDAPVKAGVYHWADLRQAQGSSGRVERLILTGSTLDLESLDVRAITIAATTSADTVAASDSLERFLLVKDGKVWAPMALSEGKLIVRDQHEMRCLDVGTK